MIATVIAPGVSTVQDGGRHGYADIGVPVSGAWHRERHLLATGLLTGVLDPGVPAIELLAGSLHLLLHADTFLTSVGPAAAHVDGHPAAVDTCLAVSAGSRVRIDHRGPGPVYVALAGWQPQRVLGSSSTDTFGGLGPAPLTTGTVLPAGGDIDRAARARVGAFHRERRARTGPIRVVPTGHPAAAAFTAARWTVTAAARSGTRLAGHALPGAGDVPSQPMVRGAVQLTPSGDPVVLGPDGGLTGGYPVVAVVATADLDRLSLLATGDEISFRACDLGEAVQAYQERERWLTSAITHPGLLG